MASDELDRLRQHERMITRYWTMMVACVVVVAVITVLSLVFDYSRDELPSAQTWVAVVLLALESIGVVIGWRLLRAQRTDLRRAEESLKTPPAGG